MIESIVNFSDRTTKQRLMVHLGALTGEHTLILKRWRPTRSNRANRLYFGVVVESLRQFLNSHGSSYTKEQAHELLASEFLAIDVVNPDTGELIGTARKSTASLNSEEFSAYIEKCIAKLSGWGIEIPDLERNVA